MGGESQRMGGWGFYTTQGLINVICVKPIVNSIKCVKRPNNDSVFLITWLPRWKGL